MGRRKKFIDKKNSATFQLFARDTSTLPSASASASDGAGGATLTDLVFVRVDNNPYSVQGIANGNSDGGGDDYPEEDDSDSIFADAPGDTDDDGSCPPPSIGGGGAIRGRAGGPLPDHVRREILELGFPDDGYNYLHHLREIKNSGGGSSYYHNSKAKLDQVPLDVKAYDASRLRIGSEVCGDANGDSMYVIASKSIGVKVQKAVDLDVVRLLDDGDLSRFGSDVEDLEEDFVVKANLPVGEKDEEEEQAHNDELEVVKGGEKVNTKGEFGIGTDGYSREQENEFVQGGRDDELAVGENQRVRRLLDEQFDMLTLREYDDSDSDDGYINTEGELLATKLKNALKEYTLDDAKLEGKYKLPGDYVDGHGESSTGKQLDISTDVLRRCVEYAEMYYADDQGNEDVVVVEESSDESEMWDCETIVSTYSNLDNHPGKIQAPENPRKRTPKILSVDSTIQSKVIALRGREKLPVEFLPHNRRSIEKVKEKVSLADDKHKRPLQGEESKEEKKDRKAALKLERREARRAKKDLKGLYKCETQRAQKVAAISGPSSIHLM